MKSIAMQAVDALDPPNRRGRPRLHSPDILFDHIVTMLRSSQSWTSLGGSDVHFKVIYRTFRRWAQRGIFNEIHRRIQHLYRRRRRPLCQDAYYATDTTFIKNIYGCGESIGRNPTDRGRGASKISIVVNQDGLVCSLKLYPANRSDQRVLDESLAGTTLRRRVPL